MGLGVTGRAYSLGFRNCQGFGVSDYSFRVWGFRVLGIGLRVSDYSFWGWGFIRAEEQPATLGFRDVAYL